MAHSGFVNAFSRISKNYVFRFQIFCFVFVAGGEGEHLVLYPMTMYSFRSEIQRQQCSDNAKFCACNQE